MVLGAQFGDAWVYLVIAHEWGHAIQYRLNASLQSKAAELQADCFAGAALYGAAADGTLLFEEGDEKEITLGLTAIADETPWTDQGDHGNAFERVQSFAAGRSGGVPACLPTS
jgi:predicted metalloprotease